MMENNDVEKTAKTEKPSSPPREQSSVHVYPDWAAFQAYYGPGAIPPPYFNPAATPGHAAHPYMWAPPQMVPPYGSPYAAIYPHGGMYGPSATPVVATPLGLDTATRSSGNDNGSAKKPKESDVNAASGNGKVENAGDGSARGQSHSTDCGSDGSGDRSDDSTTREDESSRSYNGVSDSGTCTMQIVPGIPMGSAKPVQSIPLSTPDIYHSSSTRANAHTATTLAPCTARPIEGERELKREKRKQSNRESARRSRLRKQAEMEELGRKVDSLTVENLALRSEINKLMEDSGKLRSENAALVEKLKNIQGPGGSIVSDRTDDEETAHMNTENLLERVENNSMSNADHDRGEENKNT